MSTAAGVDAVDICFNRPVRRLVPAPSCDIEVDELYGRPERSRPGHRPYVEVCMVSSIDGSTAVDGRSGGLGNRTDSMVLAALRAVADVVIVGSTTAHTERYGPPSRPGQRVGVVTRTGRIDPELPLFSSGAGFLITTLDAPDHGLDAIRAGQVDVDLPVALARLDASIVHAEGGPILNGALLDADLVDEMNVTISPTVIGGAGRRLIDGSTEALRRFRLAHVCEDDGYLFVRYVR